MNMTIDQTKQEFIFPNEPSGLYDPLRYMISIGGKRIRPKLCRLTYGLFCKEENEEIIQASEAMEVFHTFTLIHDDIMDKSALRRGMPTVWTKWDPDTAILSGDVMLIEAYKRIAKVRPEVLSKALDLFSKTAAQVCEGQQLDMDFENVPRVQMAEYEQMIGLKTAVLLACSAQMGAVVAGASDQVCQAFYDYGYQMGMAFQIADDYLDVYGDEKVFGKPIGGDIVNGKKSWMITRAFDKSADPKALEELYSSTTLGAAEKIAAVRAEYSKLDVAKDALEEIKRYSVKAIDAVSSLGLDSEAETQLKDFVKALVGRVN